MIQFATATNVRGETISLKPIAGLLDLIVAAWHPKAIWLFGSRARGEARPTSDWDLLVLVDDNEPDADDPMAPWLLRKKSRATADVILCRTSEFQEYREVPNTLAYEAAHSGVPVYGG